MSILLKIGRSQECDIVLQNGRVSRLHAEITLLNNGDILLEDKGSVNGTYILNRNNEQVRIKPASLCMIKRGDYVRFANETLSWSNIPQLPDNSGYKKIYGIGSNMVYNEIHVQSNSVSRFHATLKIDKKGRAFIEDHSLNGTTVNGVKITSHQNVRVKHNDVVIVGGVPVDLKHYIKPNPMPVILKSSGVTALVAAVVALIILLIPTQNPSIETLMKATPCVIGSYTINATIKDNPLSGLIPDTYQFGYNPKNNLWEINLTNPCMYMGTAFFISKYGELGTNRHIAVPWKYLNEEQIFQIKYQMRQIVNGYVMEHRRAIQKEIAERTTEGKILSLVTGIEYYGEYEEDENEKFISNVIEMLDKCDYEITGQMQYIGILLPGHNFNSVADLMSCQVVAESGDPQKDVAIIRLNSTETPDRIVKEGYYNLNKARLDQTQLKISEHFQTIGYPKGLAIGMEIGNGLELNPTVNQASMSRKPDRNQFQMQLVGMSGQSGSPVIDANRNLVGVLCAGYHNNEITYCCNIKHLVELYNEHKWCE